MIRSTRICEGKDSKEQSQIETRPIVQTEQRQILIQVNIINLCQLLDALKQSVNQSQQYELQQEFEAMKQALTKKKTTHVTLYSKTTDAFYKYMVNGNTFGIQLSNIQQKKCLQSLYYILKNSINFANQSQAVDSSKLFQSIDQLFVIYHYLSSPMDDPNQFDTAYDFCIRILRRYSINELKFIAEVIKLKQFWDQEDCIQQRGFPELLNTVNNYIVTQYTVQHYEAQPLIQNQLEKSILQTVITNLQSSYYTIQAFDSVSFEQKRNLCLRLYQQIKN